MKYNPIVTLKCPMCGHENKHVAVNENKKEPFTFFCDGEEGGCDRYFVAVIDITVTTKTYTYGEAER